MHSPIQHHAQFGVQEPFRRLVLVERLPSRFPAATFIDGLYLLEFRFGPFHLAVRELLGHLLRREFVGKWLEVRRSPGASPPQATVAIVSAAAMIAFIVVTGIYSR